MSRIYYYNLGGGGNSPKSWFAWIIGVAVMVGLGVLLLPFIGAVLAGMLVLGAVLCVAGFIARYFLGKKIEKEFERAARAEEQRAAGRGDASPASAGGDGLEIQDALVVDEVERRTRRDAERESAPERLS